MFTLSPVRRPLIPLPAGQEQFAFHGSLTTPRRATRAADAVPSVGARRRLPAAGDREMFTSSPDRRPSLSLPARREEFAFQGSHTTQRLRQSPRRDGAFAAGIADLEVCSASAMSPGVARDHEGHARRLRLLREYRRRTGGTRYEGRYRRLSALRHRPRTSLRRLLNR
jgi:hypothetical protein